MGNKPIPSGESPYEEVKIEKCNYCKKPYEAEKHPYHLRICYKCKHRKIEPGACIKCFEFQHQMKYFMRYYKVCKNCSLLCMVCTEEKEEEETEIVTSSDLCGYCIVEYKENNMIRWKRKFVGKLYPI